MRYSYTKVRLQLQVLFFFVLGSFISCNIFEDDASPEAIDQSALTSNRFTTPGKPIMVDLRSHIHAEGGLNFRIERQALNGTLDFLDEGFLKYEPDENYEGKDFFVIGIYSGDQLISADSTIVEVGEAAAPCFRETYHDYYEVPINGYVGFDMFPNTNHCLDSIRGAGLSYRGGDGNGSLRFGFSFLNFGEIVYLPNPGFTGVDLVQYDVELGHENGTRHKAKALVAFEVTGSEAFLSNACAETWPNLVEFVDYSASGVYEIQVEFPQSGCDLTDFTVEMEYVSNGTATFEDGHIRYQQEEPLDRIALIQYLIRSPNGDVLRRRIDLWIEGGG